MLLAVVLIPRRAASSRARRQCAISQGEDQVRRCSM